MSKPSRPPRWPLAILEALLPEESREVVIGDLVEAYLAFAPSHPVRARWRVWREALGAVVSLQFLPSRIPAFTPYTTESHLQTFIADLRHAVRVLARARGFTLLCVLTLGSAIGATTAIFSVVNPILIRRLPYPNADRLVTAYERGTDGSRGDRMGWATFIDLRDRSRSIEMGALIGGWDATIFGDQDAERVAGERVTWQYFRTLGVQPMLGRDFLAEDDTPDKSNVAILSYGLWQRRFGGDSSIIGRTLDINGIKRTVIGVMPASFENVIESDAVIWRPLGYVRGGDSACRTCRHLANVARLKPGVSLSQASREIDVIMSQLASAYPKEYAVGAGGALGLQEKVTRAARPILLTLFGAVLLVLLIAAANVANLQLARATRRQEEFAVRMALGAGRIRLAQQLAAEGLVLAIAGGISGIAIAAALLPALASRLPLDLPRADAIRLDWTTLSFTMLIALGVGVSVGLVPAIQAGSSRLFDALRAGRRSVGAASRRTRATFVVAEMALALMLVTGATLLARSLRRLLEVNPGFDASHLVIMPVRAVGAAYETPGTTLQNHERVLSAVAAVPGVTSVGLSTEIPLTANIDRYGVAAQDKPLANPELAPDADRYTVSANFIRTMRIPIVRGRDFLPAETRDSSVHVAIVSADLAKKIWGGEDPVGKLIRLGGETRPWWRVIGVAGNVRHMGLDESISHQVYVPEHQWWNEESEMMLVARTAGDPARVADAVRDAVRSVDQRQVIATPATMDDIVERSTSQRRVALLFFAFFSAIAVLLAVGGIYGVMAAAVAERNREFGVRAALGATPSGILGLVLRDGLGLALIGIAVGVAGALALSRYLVSLLYGVQPHDPLMLAVAGGVVLTTSLLACALPARRAARVDPMTALRSE
jgi:putative ABC transport system permease protein